MFTTVTDVLRQTPAIYFLLSLLDLTLAIAGCAMLAVAVFRAELRRHPVPYILCGALMCAFTAAEVFAPRVPDEDTFELILSTVGVLLPFLCMTLLFRKKAVRKAALTALSYAFVEAARFLVLLLAFGFDASARDAAAELPVALIVDLVFFAAAFFLLIRRANKSALIPDVTRDGVILFVLIVLSMAIFVVTLLLIGSPGVQNGRTQFLLMLLNIPFLTAAVTFALVRFFRVKTESENYKRQLEMQISRFAWMEQMVEDVRAFRHDLPKKMRPLIAYLDENRTDDARTVAASFSDFENVPGERFHTGNYRLDTVLFCENQLAERAGVTLDVPFDTVFPKEGIDPDDIYTIFPNALDNAIEASAAVQGDKTVTFRSRCTKDTVYVTVRNPFAGAVKTKNGLPQTTKTDAGAHGYGFKSIKKAAARYGSDNVSYTAENGVFELNIFLRFAE
ncbi:MAG: GHKL domain-containing protein [Clostridia bacterium]|nr:GHKL domain-containing protein [Clostridia bacterium]